MSRLGKISLPPIYSWWAQKNLELLLYVWAPGLGFVTNIGETIRSRTHDFTKSRFLTNYDQSQASVGNSHQSTSQRRGFYLPTFFFGTRGRFGNSVRVRVCITPTHGWGLWGRRLMTLRSHGFWNTPTDRRFSWDLENDPTRSAFTMHLIEKNHSPVKEEILHLESGFSRRLWLEDIEIHKSSLLHASFL